MQLEEIYNTISVQAWQKAKGALLEFVAIKGARNVQYDCNGKQIDSGYRKVKETIEKFIEEFEDEGLHE